MLDVLIVGAGPAGTIAGTLLARAGVQVRIVDRATFPRDKLCGDTVNPGALARLAVHRIAAEVHERGLRVGGMLVTGERGVAVQGQYPTGVCGRALVRRDLDELLLQHALRSGCAFDCAVVVRGALVSEAGGRRAVSGVTIASRGGEQALRARVTIAADGRRSAIAFGLGLARHPARPRRWAIGAYFENFLAPVDTTRSSVGCGEMHIRRGRYIGIAQVPGGLTNVCLVRPSQPGDAELRDAAALLRRELARDPLLRDRAAGARLVSPPVVLGPLAVDVREEAIDGLLLAGDAAGFIDPMTGDGLRFAIRGGEMAAAAALRALGQGWTGVHQALFAGRRAEFAGKWRFNRTLRALVASPRAVDVAAVAASVAPAALRAAIAHAGDCNVR